MPSSELGSWVAVMVISVIVAWFARETWKIHSELQAYAKLLAWLDKTSANRRRIAKQAVETQQNLLSEIISGISACEEIEPLGVERKKRLLDFAESLKTALVYDVDGCAPMPSAETLARRYKIGPYAEETEETTGEQT